jgi:hypothetical protein
MAMLAQLATNIDTAGLDEVSRTKVVAMCTMLRPFLLIRLIGFRWHLPSSTCFVLDSSFSAPPEPLASFWNPPDDIAFEKAPMAMLAQLATNIDMAGLDEESRTKVMAMCTMSPCHRKAGNPYTFFFHYTVLPSYSSLH